MMFFMTINTLLLMIRMFLFSFDHNTLKSVEKDKHYTSTLIHLYTVIGQSCPVQYGGLISQQQAKACVYVYDPEDEFKKNNTGAPGFTCKKMRPIPLSSWTFCSGSYSIMD